MSDIIQPSDVIPDTNQSQTIPDSEVTPDSETYGTTGQQLATAAEHAASSATFGLSTKAETGLGISTPEDIAARSKENPGSAIAGDITGLLIPGAPEAEALGLAGKAVSGLVRGSSALSKIGKVAVKGAVENALFQGGDEISRSFTNDPNQSAQTAMIDIGLSGLLGGAISGVGFGLLPELAEKTGVTKFAGDFGDRIKEHLTNPDLQTEGADTLASHYDQTQKGSESIFKRSFDESGNPLPNAKDQAIDSLIPPVNDKILDEGVGKITNSVMDKIEEMKADTDTYQPKFTKSLQKDFDQWRSVVDNPNATSQDIFHATESFKRITQERSKIGIPIDNSNPAFDSIKALKAIAADLRTSLENPEVWGKAGDLQKEVNSAYSKYLGPQKDFNRSFGAKIGDNYQVDPDKVQSYINQVSKEKGSIRGEKLENYITADKNYRNAINSVHEKLGVAGPFDPGSNAELNMLSNKLPAGAKVADSVVKSLIEKSGGATAGTVGAAIGGWPGFVAGKVVGGPIFDSAFSSMLKPILGAAADGTGFGAALDYVSAFAKGETAVSKGIKNLFKAGRESISASMDPSQKDKTKLDNQLKSLAENPQPMLDIGGKTSHYLPQHGQALSQTSMTAVNYLNSQRPNSVKVSPLDNPSVIDPMQKSLWNRTLGIAEQPLVVLDHIKQGTLQPSDLKTLTTLYPALYQKISQGIVNQVSARTDKSDPISYRTKMGMSLFLGQPMDSTMQPQAIMAAQPMPVPEAPQKKGSVKKPTAASAKSMETATQAEMTVQQNREAQKSGAAKT